MNLDNVDKWNEIIYDLNGTCESLDRILTRHEAEELRDYLPFLEYLDDEIFLCEGCGWWYGISEMSENEDKHGFCEHCSSSEE